MLKDAGTGSIVLLGAAGARMPYEHQVVSNVHKAGLIALTKTLAAELSRFGIRVNSVSPGRTRTALWAKRAAQLAVERGVDEEAVISEFAPIRQFFPIFAPLRMIDPIPISVFSPIVQPCSITICPIVQFAPMSSGWPTSVCSTDPSCTFEFSPIVIGSLSPRSVAPNHTLAPRFMTILPMTTALSATQLSRSHSGFTPSSS
jgi:NAD(P)-dependent dehydrogenase (short-subunit alcohol dehydrogenase family)